MIATSHPLATSAGVEILAAGGNAVDAALAAVAVQCVVEPHMTGIGGDCFALYAPKGRDVIAINGSGRAPAAASAASLRDLGLQTIPHESAHAVTIPGAISAWTRLHRDFGSLPLERLFRAAHRLRGAWLSSDCARCAGLAARRTSFAQTSSRCRGIFVRRACASGRRSPRPAFAGPASSRHRTRRSGGILRRSDREQHGPHLARSRGVHTEEDFASGVDMAHYVTPIAGNYRGFEVIECPPNGQGVIALLILKMLKSADLSAGVSLADRIHLQAEATRLAYDARSAWLADPRYRPDATGMLVEVATRGRVTRREPTVEHRDTICLSVVDRDGNAISFINSIFQAFGSFILDPESGVLLHSRGSSFSLTEGHPNMLAPGKRPLHTIIPGMLCREGKVVMPFGVMGGHYQATGHAALISGLLDQGLDIQAAIDAPRSFDFDGVLEVEPTVDLDVRARLQRLGHEVRIADKPIGGAQAIWIDHERGVLWGGSDPRKDGCAMGI